VIERDQFILGIAMKNRDKKKLIFGFKFDALLSKRNEQKNKQKMNLARYNKLHFNCNLGVR
jgi:hypothetical protein